MSDYDHHFDLFLIYILEPFSEGAEWQMKLLTRPYLHHSTRIIYLESLIKLAWLSDLWEILMEFEGKVKATDTFSRE